MQHSHNPATDTLLRSLPLHDEAQVDRALTVAAEAQSVWRRHPVDVRCALLGRLAGVLRANKNAWAQLITLEMGKPLSEAMGEIEKCAVTCEFYEKQAPQMLADDIVASNASDSRVVFDPLGVLLAVMPWNYPFWQVIRAAAPALAAGNTVVLK
ncbi:MAG: aldehyde dehydrogenase family protein, partial [Haliea sp.]